MADADRLTLQLSSGGDVVIKLRPDLAPNHVARITELANQGFYDGVVFHRVIPGFMAQGGDPTGTGYHGSDLPNIKAEFSSESHKRGVASMARSQDPGQRQQPVLHRRRRIGRSSTASIQCGARSRAAWSMLMRFRRANHRASPARSSKRPFLEFRPFIARRRERRGNHACRWTASLRSK